MIYTRKIFILLFSLISVQSVEGQNISIQDSIHKLITEETDDSIKILHYHNLVDASSTIEDLRSNLNASIRFIKNKTKDQPSYDVYLTAVARAIKLGEINQAKFYYNQIENLPSTAKNNLTKARSKITIARSYYDDGDRQMTNILLKEAELLVIGKNDKASLNILGTLYVERSLISRQEGNLDSALVYNDNALKIIVSPNLKMQAYVNRGLLYNHLGLYDSTKVYYVKAEAIGIENDFQEMLASTWNNLGNVEHVSGRYDEAIEYYMKSIDYKEAKGNNKGLAIGYHNIGAIKFDMKDWGGAKQLFNKSNEIAKRINFKTLIVYNDLKIGNCCFEEGEYSLAIDFHQKAYALAKKIKFKKGELLTLIGLGKDQQKLGSQEIAGQHFMNALSISKELKSKNDEFNILVALAEWYIDLNNSGQQLESRISTDEIEKLLIRANNLSEEMGFLEKQINVLEAFNILYDQTKNVDKRVHILAKYNALKDTLYQKQRSEFIAESETKFATAEKEKEILALEGKNKLANLRSMYLQWILGLSALLFLIAGYFTLRYNRIKNEKKRKLEAEIFRSNLSSDLHDDVGTLLSSLAMQSDILGLDAPPEKVALFQKFGALSREAMTRMRDTVWAIDSRKDNMKSLVDRMRDYISDMYEDHPMKVKFTHLESNQIKTLSPEIRQNIYLIFKEALNNALKYSNGNLVNIELKQNDKSIALSIKDNGKVGKIKTSGTGISNMKLRAQRINGKLEIHTENGFEVRLEV